MPDWLSLDRLLTVVSLVLALISIYVAYHFYRRSIRDKSLVVDQYGPLQSAGILNQTDAPILIKYNEVEVSEVWRTEVLLWNKGYRTIEAADFIAPIVATCGPSGRLLACGVAALDVATNASVTFDFDAQQAELGITRLRGREAALFYFDTDAKDARPNLSIQTKNADGVGRPPPITYFDPRAVYSFTLGLWMLVILLIARWIIGPEPPPEEQRGMTGIQLAGLLVFLGMIAATALLVGRAARALADRLLRKVMSSVVYDFYQRKRHANRLRAQLRADASNVAILGLRSRAMRETGTNRA